GIFFDLSNEVSNYQYYVFNILGPVNTSLAIVYFRGINLTLQNFQSILFLLICPILSVLLFAFIKTPNYDDINFRLSANFVTSGGFGSNQVSTVLGLGMFLVFIFWFYKWNLSGNKSLDLILFFGFVFQGLMTFSRGGILTGFLSIVSLIFINLFFGNSKNLISSSINKLKNVFLIFLFLLLAFFIVNNLSDGMLFLRYQGETDGTIGGYKEQSLNNLTSNRFDIFIGDLKLWLDHPLFGVGVGASKFMREEVTDTVAHVELSRLLAEHGIFGLVYFLILLMAPYKSIIREKSTFVKALRFSLFLLALITTFHASMRTYVTPLLIGLSLISLKDTPFNSIPRSLRLRNT
ncbi:MAG: hypothetical protein RLZZ172_1867, partial [Bacteroidota bacterium]